MELQLDTERTYALALEGGGAKGAYEIGVWQALDEAGIRFNAVSGTSVGALNGAMMAMDDLELARKLWLNIRFSHVMDVDDATMKKLFSRDLKGGSWREIAASLQDVMSNKGFDVTPLRNLLAEVVDEEKVRQSARELYIITYSLSEKRELELRARDLTEPGSIHDMLLASAYLPAFRNEPLGGKRYTDGGVRDAVPIHVLVEQDYHDIIVVRLYGFGRERNVKIPAGTRVYTISSPRDLGSVLNFDVEQSTFDLQAGYYDAKRMLYGLSGKLFYIDSQWDEQRSYEFLLEQARKVLASDRRTVTLRELNEVLLPRMEARVSGYGDYHQTLICCLEAAAEEAKIDPFRIYTEEELISELSEHYSHQAKQYPEFIRKSLLKKQTIIGRGILKR